MKSRPILFSAPMVRALLAGTKTQTRRIIKDQSIGERYSHTLADGRIHIEWLGTPSCGTGVWDVPEYSGQAESPYGRIGDQLWVRETWAEGIHQMADVGHWAYAADHFGIQQRLGERWKPSIHMPRAASRITLEITGVRVERLQDISEADAQAEGAYTDPACPAYEAYAALWEEINGPGSWDLNPWVWALEFRRLP